MSLLYTVVHCNVQKWRKADTKYVSTMSTMIKNSLDDKKIKASTNLKITPTA